MTTANTATFKEIKESALAQASGRRGGGRGGRRMSLVVALTDFGVSLKQEGAPVLEDNKEVLLYPMLCVCLCV